MSSNTDVQDKLGDAQEQVTPSRVADEEELESSQPLSLDEFRSVLQRIDDLELTWTADLPPLLRSKKKASQTAFPAKEISEIQEKYRDFPTELGNVLYYALTGSEVMRSMIGAEDAEGKAQIARDLVINQRRDFSSEFFFKYAIKVPYFVDLDWEVVIKAYERNVREMPRIPYAILSLVFRQSMSPRFMLGIDAEAGERETLTVAVDENLIEKLISSLNEARAALGRAGQIVESLNQNVTEPENKS